MLFKTVVGRRSAILFNFFLHGLLYYDYLKSDVDVVKVDLFFLLGLDAIKSNISGTCKNYL